MPKYLAMALMRRPFSLPGPAGMATGLFLAAMLAAAAVLGVLGRPEGDWRSTLGEITLEAVWEQSLAPGTVGRLSPGGLIFLWEGTRLRVADPAGGPPWSRDLTPARIALPLAGREPAASALILRAVPVRHGDHPGGEIVRAETTGGNWEYALEAGVLLAAAATPDGRRVALGTFHLDREPAEGRLHLLDSGGNVLARFNPEAGALFRLELSPGGELLAAIDPGALHYADHARGELWTRPLRGEVRDLALLSHGGPAVLTATALQAYDTRGNLLWRRLLDAPGVALTATPGVLVVATRERVTGYREDGRRVWQWVPPAVPRSLSLSADGTLLLVVAENGRASLYRLAGNEPVAAEERPGGRQ